MADRKATNKYYPPEYFDEYLEKGGKGSLNTFRGQHPLRERAKKIQDGILRIRFEMPFNIWCNGCENHIGKGVRYNADKKKVGMYYSTPILNFRMKCHLCDNYIEVQTDPQARDYVVTAGGKRKVEEWTAADAETIDLTNVGTTEGTKGGVDPFAELEKEVEQIKASEVEKRRLKDLHADRDNRFKDDYGSSQMLRHKFRQQKKGLKEGQRRDEELRRRLGTSIPLSTPKRSDAKEARETISTRVIHKPIQKEKKRNIISTRPTVRALTPSQKAEEKLRKRGVDVGRLQKGRTREDLKYRRTLAPSGPSKISH